MHYHNHPFYQDVAMSKKNKPSAFRTDVTKFAHTVWLVSRGKFPARQDLRVRSVPDRPGGSTALKAPQQYTGTAMLGVATMHKSNSVPVFSSDDAKDITRMRR